MSGLIDAARNNDLDKLRRAIDKTTADSSGVDTDTAMQDAGKTAARYDHVEALGMLLDSGCDLSTGIISSAFEANSKTCLDEIFSRGFNINNQLGSHGSSTLLIRTRDPGMTQYLLSRGADPNAHPSSMTALEAAAFFGHLGIVQILLDAGAKLETRSALSDAARHGHTEIVSYLLDRGASIDEIPNNESTTREEWQVSVKNALCEAAAEGQPAVLELLLRRGANINVKDSKGQTALALAKEAGNESCVAILEQHRRDGAVKDGD